MRISTCLFFFALAITAAAQTAATIPVGYSTVTIAAGNGAANPSYTTLSVPFYKAAEFTGTIASVDSATQITLNNAAWTTNQYYSVSAPRFAKITSGNAVGRFFVITANTASQLSLDLSSQPTIATLLGGTVSAGDSVQIIPALTLANFFGSNTATLPANWVTGASANSADQVWIITNPTTTTWSTFYNNGTNWKKSGNLLNQNNTIIFPDDGIRLVHIGTNPVTLTLSGTVPSTSEKTDIYGAGTTFMANRFPVNTTMLGAGFHLLPGWVTGNSANSADKVWLWNPIKAGGAGWDTYYYTGSIWKKAGNLSSQNNAIIYAGTAVQITRLNQNPASITTLQQSLPYSLE